MEFIPTDSNMKQVWMPLNTLPHLKNHGRQILRAVCRVIVMALNPIMIVQQMRRSSMIEVRNHIPF